MKEENYSLNIDEELEGLRLDKALAVFFSETFSRSYIKKMIDSGRVLVNKEKKPDKYKVKIADAIECIFIQENQEKLLAENISLDILYEDQEIIVINKASGMVVHPGAGNRNGTLVNALLYHYASLSDVGGSERAGIIHRLDKETSGVMVLAKTNRAHSNISAQFESRKVKKKYRGFAFGILEYDNGVIDEPIARDRRHRTRMRVSYAESKSAQTDYHVRARYARCTDLDFTLHTGRTHQVRVHMASIGHPLIGDKEYAPKHVTSMMNRHALHSALLGIYHPVSAEYIEFKADLPEDMKYFIEECKKESS